MSTFKQNAVVTELQGLLERVTDGWVYGWAWDRSQPNATLDLDIHIDGRLVTTLAADSYRPDLQEAGIGNGKHAFKTELPLELDD